MTKAFDPARADALLSGNVGVDEVPAYSERKRSVTTHDEKLCQMLREKFGANLLVQATTDRNLLAAYTCWRTNFRTEHVEALPALLDSDARAMAWRRKW